MRGAIEPSSRLHDVLAHASAVRLSPALLLLLLVGELAAEKREKRWSVNNEPQQAALCACIHALERLLCAHTAPFDPTLFHIF
jgi:hypothetical protein